MNYENATVATLLAEFKEYDREANFSLAAIEAILEFLQECCGEDEIDVIAISTEFTELETRDLNDFVKWDAYNLGYDYESDTFTVTGDAEDLDYALDQYTREVVKHFENKGGIVIGRPALAYADCRNIIYITHGF